tara:strand:- start:68 stop:427 length:360 start_codon:yes stop_codon:yes gene_type:complete
MITTGGRTFLRDQITTNVGWKIGSGGDSTNPNASDLDSPITYSGSTAIQTSGITRLTSGESAIDYTITILGSAIVGEIIKEIGLYETGGSTLICRVPLDPIGPIVSTDEVEIIITLEVD